MLRFAPLTVAIVLLAVPAAAENPREEAASVHRETGPRTDFIATGSVLFGLGYASVVSAAALAPSIVSKDLAPLYVPIAGPFLTMRDASSGGVALLAIDGVVQTGGLVLAIIGAASDEPDLARKQSSARGITVAPIATPSLFGLGIAGAL